MLRKIFSLDLLVDALGSSLSLSLIGLGLVVARYASVWLGLTIGLVGLVYLPPIYKRYNRLRIPDSFIAGQFGLAGVYFVVSVLSIGITIGRAQAGKVVSVQLMLGDLGLDLCMIALTSAYMFHTGFRQKIVRFFNSRK